MLAIPSDNRPRRFCPEVPQPARLLELKRNELEAKSVLRVCAAAQARWNTKVRDGFRTVLIRSRLFNKVDKFAVRNRRKMHV